MCKEGKETLKNENFPPWMAREENNMAKKLRSLLPVLVLLLLSLMWQTNWAASKGEQPGKHLKTTEVLVNSDDETITIILEDLDFGPGPLVVRLGDEAIFGDITAACAEDLVSTPQTIICDFSAAGLDTGLPPDGDYLLTVATGDGQSQSDEYDLTIGNLALAGQSCSIGQFLTGFDSAGGILCAEVAGCGNASIDPGEACDDGNDIDGDGCSTSCQIDGVCGDGVVNPPGEACDDGGESATCDTNCTAASCGDGTLNTSAGEACDDGNTIDGDGCSSSCQFESP
jgi:cysteine-rich repeat protein